MRVWIDQDLCTGDGICSEIAPDVFQPRDDGLVGGQRGSIELREQEDLRWQGRPGWCRRRCPSPGRAEDITIEAAEECPGECIMLEP